MSNFRTATLSIFSKSKPTIWTATFSNCSKTFDISPFHLFELFSNFLQSKPTQAAIFEQFFDFELQSTQTWTRIRATIRARVRIRTTIRARAIVTVEKCAREAASLGAIGHGDNSSFSNRV
mgnify:CR=1 FL=1